MKRMLEPIRKLLLGAFTMTFLCMAACPGYTQDKAGPAIPPFVSQYFTNRYLGNPSMAGLDSGLILNAAYRQQYNGIPGAPLTEAVTAGYNPGKRVGLGLIAFNDKAALISRTRFGLTYAYHLPVGQFGQQLHFGITGTFAHLQVDPKGLVGDEPDPAVAEFNGHKNYFDIDYGMAYTDKHVTLQASVANLLGFMKDFNNSTPEVSTIYSAAAYKFTFDGTVNSIEPQVSLQGIKNYNSILDIGANMVMFHHILNISGIFRSSNNYIASVGLNYKNIIYIQASYLSKTTGLEDYTDGNYEIDLALNLFGKAKK